MSYGPTTGTSRKEESDELTGASLPARPERAGFVEDLRREPEALDLPLVYADWLEDHGEPERAEFVRVRCELAALSGSDPGRGGLEDRAEELLAAHEREWLGPFSAVGDAYFSYRGLVERLYVMGLSAFLERAPDLMAREPIRSLAFGRGLIGPTEARTLTQSTDLTPLEGLCLDWQELGDEGALALSGATGLPNLKRLQILASRIGAEGARALARSAHFARLHTLDLTNNPIGSAGALALADSPHLTALRVLYLHGAGIGRAGAVALAESPHLGGLEQLALAFNGIDDATRELLRRRFGHRVVL